MFRKPTVTQEQGAYIVSYRGKEGVSIAQLDLRIQPPSNDPGPTQIQITVLPNREVRLMSFTLHLPGREVTLPKLGSTLRMLHHGHQSWSFTGAVQLKAPFVSPGLRDLTLLPKGSMGDRISNDT